MIEKEDTKSVKITHDDKTEMLNNYSIIRVLSPKSNKLPNITQKDVWGSYDENWKKISDGMIVARTSEKCPVFGDILEYKDVTVICKLEEEKDVIYWLEYVHGCNCVTKRKELKGDKVALRSEYQSW